MILAGDIGGTHARFALYEPHSAPGTRDAAHAPGTRGEPGSVVAPVVRFEKHYPVAAHPTFEHALAQFVADATAACGRRPIAAGCLGIAGPVLGTRVPLTNAPWVIDAEEASAAIGGARVRLVNDFEASATGTTALAPDELFPLQAGDATPGNRVVIGAGTGLGVAYLVPVDDGFRVVPGEGGHIGFSPADAEQDALHSSLRAELGRVDAEHVVSGGGIVRIYRFLRGRVAAAGALDDARLAEAGAARIAAEADAGDPLANRALDLFARCFGAVAGDHALSVLARGGVLLAGGIAPRMLARLAAGGFVAAFTDKGDFRSIAQSFPVHVVTHPSVGLLGAAVIGAALAEGRG